MSDVVLPFVVVSNINKLNLRFSVTKQVIKVHHRQFLGRASSTFIPNTNPPLSITNSNPEQTETHSHPFSQLFFNQQNVFYTNLFFQLKSPPHLFEAKRLHALLIVCGFFSPSTTDRVLGSQLVHVYVKFGCLQEALLVFNELPNKSNNIAWNAILRGFVDMGMFSRAIEFYYSMLKQDVVPDNFTYPLVLKAFSGMNDLEQGRSVQRQILLRETRRNMKRNIYVECAMIDMFAKCGSLEEARKVFEEMPKRDLVSWSAMICGAVQSGEWLEALYLFNRMRLEGLRPDSVIVAAILPACGRLEDKQMGMLLHGGVIRIGLENELFVLNALIDMYCKCSDTNEARRVFCGMVCKDVVSWSTLIAGYSQNCQYHESFELYLEMNSAGRRTNCCGKCPSCTIQAQISKTGEGDAQLHSKTRFRI